MTFLSIFGTPLNIIAREERDDVFRKIDFAIKIETGNWDFIYAYSGRAQQKPMGI